MVRLARAAAVSLVALGLCGAPVGPLPRPAGAAEIKRDPGEIQRDRAELRRDLPGRGW
jgi:hypothetical protein